jgi:phospholipid/cholesterol/gamma-HCH transport system substrate-binding protein
MRETVQRRRQRLFGLAGVLVLGLSVFFVYASYTELFSPVVHAQVIADRSGLELDDKADVTLRGMKVGEVRAVTIVNGQAVIDIAIDRQYVDVIPGNVGADIDAPTLFGAKFINLLPPSAPSAQPIADGTVIHSSQVSTETNSLFGNLMSLLTAVKPAELDATLGAVATALQGRGAQLGSFISDLNGYLTHFNPTLPAVNQDLAALPDVTGTYAAAAPNLVRILGNVTTTSKTLQDRQAGLAALLLSVTRVSNEGASVLDDSGQQLVDAFETLRPTTQLLAYYSPEFPCLLANINLMRHSSLVNVGGQYNGIHGLVTFMPGQAGYQPGVDDPKVAASGPPKCYPGGVVGEPYVPFDDGTHSVDFNRTTTTVVTPMELAQELLGSAITPFVAGGGR